jgi:NAD(P)-dependent dehydrogenase (short-subunit alcohol dehydrogenase family)
VNHRRRISTLFALAAGSAAAAAVIVRRSRNDDMEFYRKVVLITGGSRGLGMALARRFAEQGAKLVLCARNEDQLKSAKRDLAELNADVLTVPCDVSDRKQVERLVRKTLEHYGRIDVLVNNAGIIKVGPVLSMTEEDFAEAMDVMFWGSVNTTLAALPHLRNTHGTVVNVTSIGGKVSVPHLLPYCCAKFATVAFSEGMRAELQGTGVRVVTIAPGLMRTGSHVNAKFKGHSEAEAAWFGVSASMPGLSMSADRAASQILRFARTGRAEGVLSIPAKVLARFHGLFPGLTADLLGTVNRLLPHGEQKYTQGWKTAGRNRRWLNAATILGSKAARQFLQPGVS